jgi:hypothetical protein
VLVVDCSWVLGSFNKASGKAGRDNGMLSKPSLITVRPYTSIESVTVIAVVNNEPELTHKGLESVLVYCTVSTLAAALGHGTQNTVPVKNIATQCDSCDKATSALT